MALLPTHTVNSIKWHERFFALIDLVETWSKDGSTPVAAVIADGKHFRSLGYNGFPAGVLDEVPGRHERPAKYLYTCHAEENAIHTAHRHGTSVAGCTMYVNRFPCATCARAIISTGIRRVVTRPIDPESPFWERWRESIDASSTMFEESGVQVLFVPHQSSLISARSSVKRADLQPIALSGFPLWAKQRLRRTTHFINSCLSGFGRMLRCES